jgi:hypothetical protein
MALDIEKKLDEILKRLENIKWKNI